MNTSNIQFQSRLLYSDPMVVYNFTVHEGERQYTMLLGSDLNVGIFPNKLLNDGEILKDAINQLYSQSSLKDREIIKIQTSLVTALSEEELAILHNNRNNLGQLPAPKGAGLKES